MFNNVEVKDNGKRIMAVITIASKNRMTIPSSVREAMNLERGDAIAFLNYQNHVGIIKINEENLIETIKADFMK
jgi:AbrB family looped-hinge helix DNA binding protein